MSDLDPRLNAFRDDLADQILQGHVEAAHFVEGKRMRIVLPVVNLCRHPRPDSGVDTQLLMGETVRVFDVAEGYAWVQSEQDGYVGYVSDVALEKSVDAPTHRVKVPRTFLYPGPDLRFPASAALSMGSELHVVDMIETRGSHYAVLKSGGAIFANHLEPVSVMAEDYVGVAQSLLHTPYLWGGKSALGIDCSGLVQLAMMMCGRQVLRDTDMQEKTIGEEISLEAPLQRGDLVFWKGHVAIMVDAQHIIHANGASMDVRIEPLSEAVERIARLYAKPTCARRA